ncbi:MAG: NADH-quinone oxidoreductase subunit NuoK [Pseudomonadota bacterium]
MKNITTGALQISALLFGIGLLGVIIRRNILIVLMSVELMLNAVNVMLIGFSRGYGEIAGQGMAFLIIALAAAEAAVGLAIVVAIFRTRKTLNVDEINLMKH